MRRTRKIISVLMIIAAMTVALSCKESFTEADALKAQQSIDLALYIVNQSDPNQAPISGAKVTVNQNGVNKDVVTDATGAALFPAMKIGDFIYNVSATNFLALSATGSATPANYRQAQSTVKIGLLSTGDADMATVKGTIFMEKDITNSSSEFASAVDVNLTVAYVGYGTKAFTTKTDANGAYTIKIPVNALGSSTIVNLSLNDIEADQTYGLNKYGDETGSFPTVLPRKETQKTVFSLSTSGEQFRTLPSSGNVRSVWGVADAPPAAGSPAIISGVTTNATGLITGITFSDGGNYTGDADGKVTIAISSNDGGSGGSVVVTLGSNSNVSNAYAGLSGGSRIISGGSGYPASTTSGFTLNKTGTVDPSIRTGFTIQKGTIAVANASFGTGIFRPRQIL